LQEWESEPAIFSFPGSGWHSMLYRIARFLQLGGLIVLPIAISGNVANKLDLRDSLSLSAVGVVAFIVGWSLQQFVKPP